MYSFCAPEPLHSVQFLSLTLSLHVTLISTIQSLPLSGAAASQRYSLRIGEEWKMAAHHHACHCVGVVFITMVVESWEDGVKRLLGTSPGLISFLNKAMEHLLQIQFNYLF